MFENQNKKIELIIVCDEKTKLYADYLTGLIGENDDVDGEVIGTKDGMINATVWTPKEYENNRPKITSNIHVLFIGSFKEARQQGENVNFRFSKYGMRYGWLGKRAVMYVEKTMLKKDDYDSFISFSKKYQKEFDKATANVINTLPNALKLGALGAGAFVPILGSVALYSLISGGIAHKKIMDQQYRCLIMVMYLEGLQQFLEG
jgi:hypothetical protein